MATLRDKANSLSANPKKDLIEQIASELHEQWRRSYTDDVIAKYKESTEKNKVDTLLSSLVRNKDDGAQGQININQSFDKLNPHWQMENRAAAEAALEAICQFGDNIDAASSFIHDEWMKRNPINDYNEKLHVDYNSLPQSEKDKDIAQFNLMKEALEKITELQSTTEPPSSTELQPTTLPPQPPSSTELQPQPQSTAEITETQKGGSPTKKRKYRFRKSKLKTKKNKRRFVW